MTNTPSHFRLATLALAGLAQTTAHALLVEDGGFEPPNPTAFPGAMGGAVLKVVGESFGGPGNDAWTVVQTGGGVADVGIVSTTQYTNTLAPFAKTYFNAQSGLQWIDLSGLGPTNARIGVQQVIPTTAATDYQLSFYVGNYNSIAAALAVDIGGITIGSFTSSLTSTFPAYNGDGVAGVTWQQFTYNFTATGAATTIGFFNLAPGGVTDFTGLDEVSLAVIPEPASAALLLMGVATLAGARRRRSAASL